ncbi:MAG: hypothetical protein ACTS4X_02095, partial [Candidatus Hodgkinia cicadicola]
LTNETIHNIKKQRRKEHAVIKKVTEDGIIKFRKGLITIVRKGKLILRLVYNIVISYKSEA